MSFRKVCQVGFLRRIDKEEVKKLAEIDLSRAEGLNKILTHNNWSIVRGVLDTLKDQAVTELSRKGLESRDMERLNHRLELLKDIDSVFDRIMKRGTEALKALEKLKEKSNDRASN